MEAETFKQATVLAAKIQIVQDALKRCEEPTKDHNSGQQIIYFSVPLSTASQVQQLLQKEVEILREEFKKL